jgi:hypothetical protein
LAHATVSPSVHLPVSYFCLLSLLTDEPLQQQPSSAALQQQLQALASEQAALLASLQVLLSGLSCCSAGWAYLRAAGPGLEALACAVSADTKVRCDFVYYLRIACTHYTLSAGTLHAAVQPCGVPVWFAPVSFFVIRDMDQQGMS